MAIIYLTIVVVVKFFTDTSDTNETFVNAPAARANSYSIFAVVPLVLFAYTCHPNVLPIYSEMK